MSEITMPRLSDTMEEGTIARWLKHAGDEVKKGDILAEIETDKATMDLEAYQAGILEQILVQEGETVPIGQAVAVIGSGAGTQTRPMPEPSATKDAQKQAQSTPTPAVAETRATPAVPARAESTQPERAGTQAMSAEIAESSDGQRVGMIKVSPLARRMAQEHSID